MSFSLSGMGDLRAATQILADVKIIVKMMKMLKLVKEIKPSKQVTLDKVEKYLRHVQISMVECQSHQQWLY